ncbi:unnamed protein product [Moneuplotes crassus]|uniref:RING-type domain-containing protein n=1 Tax=Euplotes crassus TaxID=5936 RepID=A0AAD1XKE8_EUPCR|nr:unnamed protein product [Moneuplotes crassus]
MWLTDLLDEFYQWLWLRKAYSACSRCKNFIKFTFFTTLSIIIFIITELIDLEELSDKAHCLFLSLKILAIADIVLYLIRSTHLCRSFREVNFILFLHCLVHLGFIANVVVERVYMSDSSKSMKWTRKNIKEYWFIYIFVLLRVLVYVILIIFNILCFPCIFKNVLDARRQRENIFYVIRRSRNNPAFLENRDLEEPLLEYNQRDPPVFERVPERIPERVSEVAPDRATGQDHIPYAPVPVQRRNQVDRASFHQRLRHVLGEQNIEPIDRGTLALLKKVTYFSEKDRLPDIECSICLQPFSDFQSERLIYLPCNRKHIFHSNCIIDWLKLDRNCPLCRIEVNSEILRNSGY